MKKSLAVILSIFMLFSLFCACGDTTEKQNTTSKESDTTEKTGLSVVCTIFPQYDFCREIIGSADNIELLQKNKVDMHSYKPSAEDILKIKNCDLFINIGGESDEWAEDAIASAKNEKLSVLSLIDSVEAREETALEGMEEEEEHDHEDEEAELDEHVWTSLKNAKLMVAAIADRLCELDEKNAALYKKNASAYTEKLDALEAEYEKTTDSAATKTLVFADRYPFRYLAEDYSLECFAAFSGCSAETQASFETIAFLAQKVKENDLKFVLMIDGSDGSVAETVASQSGAAIRSLNSCQSVSQEEIESGTTYLSIMESNLEVLREVLG